MEGLQLREVIAVIPLSSFEFHRIWSFHSDFEKLADRVRDAS